MSEIFRLENVKFKNIIDIKNLSINKGETTTIIGKSGSGKTTIISLLNKMITADNGEIFYNGKNIKEINSISLRREVVMLGQEPIIFNGNLRDNLNVGLKFSYKPNKNDVKLKEYLRYVDLNKNLDDDISNFSGGEKQRVALLRVILMEPEVFLLDEPSSALDENLANYTIDVISKIASVNNKTIVMVTHSKGIANDFSDRIITVESGKVVRDDRRH